MFEVGDSVDAERVRAVVAWLRSVDREMDNAARIELITALTELNSAGSATQAKVSADFATDVVAQRTELGVPAPQRDRGITTEIALARRESPYRGNRHLGFAKAVVHEMPHTLALMEHGLLSEWRATILVRETACSSREDRSAIDIELCSDPTTLHGLGDQALSATVREHAARRDAEAMVRRARKAVEDRCVTTRPAPDTMAYVTALLPVREAITVRATLERDADSLRAAGDSRSRAQVMADLLIERVTGIDTAVGAPITVSLVISDQTLLGDGTDHAHIDGYGPVPAGLARQWVHDTEAIAMLRRDYANPGTGALTAIESKARCLPTGMGRLVDVRDRICRTPWCDAPIRHHDHIKGHREGGATDTNNTAGLCEACNYAKEAEGWRARPEPPTLGALHSYTLTTSTGHTYRSTAPPLPAPLEAA